jgi:hypothetical protein
MSDFVIVNDNGLEELQANTERAFAWMHGKERTV